jgi:hypothetical protein
MRKERTRSYNVQLSSFGVKYELQDWIANFLFKRSQQVIVDACMSDLEEVVSGVPQGSVLGPILFLLYVSDIDTCCHSSSKAKTFADDTKFYQSYSLSEELALPITFSNLEKWANKWQLKIEQTKCYHLSTGHFSIPSTTYSIMTRKVKSKVSVDDLGILLTSDLKFAAYCETIVSKAFARANLILKAFSSNDHKLLIIAYTTYVRHILEYNSCTWNPYLLKDIEKLESVQRFFTRKVCTRCKINYESYNDRLIQFNLQPLEFRRLKADICMTYKIIHNLVDLEKEKFFNFRKSITRGNSLKIWNREKSYYDIHRHFFSQRVIPIWNALNDSTIHAVSLQSFKTLIDKSNLNKFLLIYKKPAPGAINK